MLRILFLSIAVTLLISCGDGNDTEGLDTENKDNSKPKVDFLLPDYQAVIIDSNNVEEVVIEAANILSAISKDLAYILDNRYAIDQSEYGNEYNQNTTIDISDTVCKNGGKATYSSIGSYLSNGAGLSLYKEGYSNSYFYKQCFVYDQEGFEQNYVDGLSKIEIQKGFVKAAHYPYHFNWVSGEARAEQSFEQRTFVNSLTTEILKYYSGLIRYHFISDTEIKVSHSNFYAKEENLDIFSTRSNLEYYLDKTNFSISQSDKYNYKISNKDASLFNIGLNQIGGLVKVIITSPFEVDSFNLRKIDQGAFSIRNNKSIVNVKFNPDSYIYSFDSDGDGDFEISGTINL